MENQMGCNDDENLLRDIIKLKARGAGALTSFRNIWHSLRLKHLVNVPRRLVASIIKEIIDPEEVMIEERYDVRDAPMFLCFWVQ